MDECGTLWSSGQDSVFPMQGTLVGLSYAVTNTWCSQIKKETGEWEGS